VVAELVSVVLPAPIPEMMIQQLAVAGVAGQFLGAFEELRPVPP